MRCWCGCLSGARCRLFAYRPADATASQPPSSLFSFKSRLVWPFWYWLTQDAIRGSGRLVWTPEWGGGSRSTDRIGQFYGVSLGSDAEDECRVWCNYSLQSGCIPVLTVVHLDHIEQRSNGDEISQWYAQGKILGDVTLVNLLETM